MTDTDLLATPGVDTANPSDGRESDSGQISKMSEHTDVARSGLTGMLLPQLRALAGELGIRGTSGMRKGDLIAAIKENQASAGTGKSARGGRGDAKSAEADAGAEPAAKSASNAGAATESGASAKTDSPQTSENAAESTGKGRAKNDAPKGTRNGAARGQQQTLDGVGTENAAAKAETAESAARPADSGDESGRDGGQRGRGRQRR
ncbi:transcription termination factor Rho, partial [Nocardia nova]|uniref:Rho termination factor N-terminal domain-containing protein n=1 Tax=Nocardia nova TaxID=37330 RepID=UPI0025B1FC29